MTDSRRRDRFALAFLLLLPTVLFFDVVIGKGVFYAHDVSMYHFPTRRILREIVMRGEFPFWNPWISAGQPLAANPAHQVFYPPTWLIFLPDFIHGFQLLALVHVFVAVLATYFFVRSLNGSRVAAIFGALSFGLGGFVLSGLQLFPFLFSASWMPLTLLFGRKAILYRQRRYFAFAALFLALQCLVGEPVVLVQTGLLLGTYAVAVAVRERNAARGVRDVVLVAAIGVAALTLAAVQILPAIDHARDSVRAAGFDFAHVSSWSTPPVRFAELLFPDVFGSRLLDTDAPRWDHRLYAPLTNPFFASIYPGIIATILALAGVFGGVRGRGLFLTVIVTSVLLALGSHTPLLRLLHDHGIAGSIRFPEKFLIMGLTAIAVYSAIALDAVLSGDRRVRRWVLAITALVLLAASLGAASTFIGGAARLFRELWSVTNERAVRSLAAAQTGWLLACVRTLLVLIAFAALPRLSRRTGAALIVALAAGDLAMQVDRVAPRTGRAFYERVPPSLSGLPLERNDYRAFLAGDVALNTRNRAPYLVRRPNLFMIERNALAGFGAAEHGVRTVMEPDYDLTALASTNTFVSAMWDVSKRSADWLNYAAAMSNVWYVGLYRPFDDAVAEARGYTPLLRPIRWVAGVRYPRYYFATDFVPIRDAQDFVDQIASGKHSRQAAFVTDPPRFRPAPGKVVRHAETTTSARIDVESRGLSFLVMSVSAHKYWTTTIDGREVPVITTNLGYQGVMVPPGRHVIVMRYRNPLVTAGAAISIAALIALIAIAWSRPRLTPIAAH